MSASLLKPSLAAESAPPAALFSPRALFFVGFFGGIVALVLFSAINSFKLRRPLDVLAYIAAILIELALIYAQLISYAPYVQLTDWLGSSGTRYVTRVASMLLWGALYLLHRKQHRANSLFGAAAPSPWIAGIVCGAAGFVLTLGAVQLVERLAA